MLSGKIERTTRDKFRCKIATAERVFRAAENAAAAAANTPANSQLA
jgi:hypothetical protein